MGNRGCLHDEHRVVGRAPLERPQAWVACLLAFRGPAPRAADETRPLHRAVLPRRGDGARRRAIAPAPSAAAPSFRRFVEAWSAAAGHAADERVRAADMDRAIHAGRVDRRHGKITFDAPLAELPDGTVVAAGEQALLKWNAALLPWSFEGYGAPRPAASDAVVTVLTPLPIVEILRAGYRPDVHPTAEG